MKNLFKHIKDLMNKKEHQNNNCPIPGCPIPHDEEPDFPDPNCKCGKPLWIYIPPGGHIHPCPVHPDYVVRGPDRMW